MDRRFRVVDVFSERAFAGNPVGVVLDGEGISPDEMQRITRWLNLSETTFLLPPTEAGADYRVRIFTLARELPFAGHPTLGSCHAWLAAGGVPARAHTIVQQCGAGLVTIRRHADRLAFAAPPLLRGGALEDMVRAEVAGFLRIDPARIVDAQWVDNGPGWKVVLLGSAAEVLAVEPARAAVGRMDVGVVGPHEPGGAAAFELRAFFTDADGGVREDPVTGSLNASVAQWLFASGRARGAYVAAQGTRLGRAGRVHVEQDAAGQVWIGGATASLVCGTIAVPAA